jgi:dTDP-4-dehydrorhamnose reductase
MKKRILVLGCTGKMGRALLNACPEVFEVVGLSSKDFDARHPQSVRSHIDRVRPHAIINTVGYLGIDPCEQHPEDAFAINTLFPYELAKMANQVDARLVHFSTDAVFNGDEGKKHYSESDQPSPVNVYGVTKLGGDILVQNTSHKYFVIRVSLLFGPSEKNNQFVEKMICKIRGGEKTIRVSADIFCSPCFSEDVAQTVFMLIQDEQESGVYHVANEGETSLYGLMREIVKQGGIDACVEPASHKDFLAVGKKNLCTPLVSGKIKPLRPWQLAVRDYVDHLG